MPETWPTHALIAAGDAYIEAYAAALDSIFPGVGDVLRDLWLALRPIPTCDCPMGAYHRWNCTLTPIWAQTMRDQDINPFTVLWLPLSERDFQTMWRRAGRDPIPHARMIEGREHTSWFLPGSGLIVETVVPANPPLRGMIESFIAFDTATENPRRPTDDA